MAADTPEGPHNGNDTQGSNKAAEQQLKGRSAVPELPTLPTRTKTPRQGRDHANTRFASPDPAPVSFRSVEHTMSTKQATYISTKCVRYLQ